MALKAQSSDADWRVYMYSRATLVAPAINNVDLAVSITGQELSSLLPLHTITPSTPFVNTTAASSGHAESIAPLVSPSITG